MKEVAPGSPARPRRRRVSLELQLHPADIRRPLRTLFLSRRQLSLAVVVTLLLAVYVAAGLVGLPWALRDWLLGHEIDRAVAERGRLGERLQQLVARLDGLNEEAGMLHGQVGRIYLVYGLGNQRATGQGGYPTLPEDLPAPAIYRAAVERGSVLHAEARERVLVLSAFLEEIGSFEQAHGDQVRTTPSMSPLRGEEFVLTSPFGYRRSPFTGNHDFHAGLDLAAAAGTPILAPAEGVVVFAGRYPLSRSVAWWRYGNLVAIRHGDRFTTLFGHCDEIHVERGQRVVQGQVLATVGNTGWSTSPHLHYEVRLRQQDGEHLPLDPRIYILDHEWDEREDRLVLARGAPDHSAVEPLPSIFGR